MPDAQLKIYLAGPLSACNESQRTVWRTEFKSLFGKSFDFADPVTWGKDWNPALEMKAVEESAVIVANMWKESIGTTIGIVRARMSGKPVVLIDPNHLHSPILKGLVEPEVPVHSLAEAKKRLLEIVKGFRPSTRVRKKGGEEEAFSRATFVRSIAMACDQVGFHDGVYRSLIVAGVTTRLKALQAAGAIDSRTIRDEIFRVLDDLATKPVYPPDVKRAVLKVKESWVVREEYKGIDQLYDEAVDAKRAAEDRVKELDLALTEMRRAKAGSFVESDEVRNPPKTLVEVVEVASNRFGGLLRFAKRAFDASANSPYAHPESAMTAFEALAECARERQDQKSSGEKAVGIREWFRKNASDYPGIEFKARESKPTMNMYGDERRFEHDGSDWVGEMHLGLGSGKPTDCLRVHFACDERTLEFIIGHAGRHLSTVSR